MLSENMIDRFITFMNHAAETFQYTSWSDKFAREEINRSMTSFLTDIQEEIDFKHLTLDTAVSLGFKRWEEKTNLYLIPLYLLPIIPVGTEVVSIFGDHIIYNGKNLNNDNRFGCLAYGIMLNEEEDNHEC